MDIDNKPDNTPSTQQSPVGELEFQASQVIQRFEEASEKAENGDGSGEGETWKSSYGFLPMPSKSTDEIVAMLEDMIIHEDASSRESTPDEESLPHLTVLPHLDSTSRIAIVTHSIAAYSSGLERTHLQHLNSRITADTTRWLSHLFRFYESATFVHEDALEGVVRLTRMMLHYKYPKYLDDGFDALAAKPPVIYSSVASPLGVVQHICRQLGLPMFCVRPVPCNTMFGSQQKLDVAALERLVEEDKLCNRVPLIVLADAGTPVAGHVDNLPRLQELCKHHDVWLHLRGHTLAALAMVSVPNLPTRVADSLTLQLGVWLGVPSLPAVTMYRLFEVSSQRVSTVGVARESTLATLAGLKVDHLTRRLNLLPLWATLQAMGRDGVQARIRHAFQASEQMWQSISRYPCIRLLSPEPGGESGNYTVQELVTKPVTTNVLFEAVACSVVFQFVPEPVEGLTPPPGRVPAYYDKLNSWLGQILQRDAPHVPIEICELESSGVVLRYCPLEAAGGGADRFLLCLEQQLDILTATVQHREAFRRQVAAAPRLQLVEMPGWAGLGGVRYVPAGWEDQAGEAGDELNRLNVTLVDSLRSTDAAFSLGEGVDGLACVRFGMVTADTDVEELLGLVVTVGKEVEESSRFLDNMSEIVKKGIEAVTQDLKKENEERIWQEGILRHVPVFGSLVNWWSPPSREGGIKGRSLNLQAGVVESTENIYRYHMQLQQGASSPPGGRGPPQPQVQTPVSGNHSRSSSHSSQQSGVAVQPPATQSPAVQSPAVQLPAVPLPAVQAAAT